MFVVEPIAPSLDGEVWPAHPQPRPDELFSSWLARLAHANGLSPHVLCALEWPGRRLLHVDLDRGAIPDVLERFTRRASAPSARVQETTLAALTGRLYERYEPAGRVRWLLPWANRLGKRGGCQFCPECLVEDGEDPYLRRAWRLSLTTACVRHRRLLRDACPGCGSALAPFWCLVSRRGLPVEVPVAACRRCGYDLRTAVPDDKPKRGRSNRRLDCGALLATDDLSLIFQDQLGGALTTGWVEVLGHGPVYSHLYFNVVHQLLKLLTAVSADALRLGAAVRRELNREDFAPAKGRSRQGVSFDGLAVAERHILLGMAGWLLEDWPRRFVDLCRRERVWATTLLADMEAPPFWFERVVNEELRTLHTRWRDPARPKAKQPSYRVLTLRRTSRRLAAQERRIEFTRAHPELWAEPLVLARSMRSAGLYSSATHPTAIAKHCPKLVALAKNPNEWWRDRSATRAVVPDLHGPVRTR